MGRLLSDLTTTWELKDVENFDDPTVRFVGCYWGHEDKQFFEPYYHSFIADGEWFLGYQAEANPSCSETTYQKYLNYINSINIADVLVLSHQTGSSSHTKAPAAGIVLYWRDLPVLDHGTSTTKTYRVFKMAWTNKTMNLDLPKKGFGDRSGSISKGYKRSDIIYNKIPEMPEKSVQDAYKALVKEIDKARFRFLRLNLANIIPRNY